MHYYILDKNMKIVSVASTNSTSNEGFLVLDDEFHEYSNAPATLDLTFDFYHESTKDLVEGAFIVFKYLDKYRLFTIAQIEETHSSESEIKVYAEEISFQLLDAVVFPNEYQNVSLPYLLGIALADTDFMTGEVSDINVESFEFDAFGTALEQVKKLAEETETILTFRVNFSPNAGVTGKYVDLVEKIQVDEGKRLEFGHNVDSVKRTVDRTTICTAVIPIGENDTLINGFNWVNYYDDKTISKDKESYYLKVDEEIRNEINPNSEHHIFATVNVESSDKTTLCQKAYEYLKNHKNPKYTYEVEAVVMNGATYQIGEQVRIIDDMMNISMIAEVEEVSTSFCNPDANSIVLTNYIEKEANIAQMFLDIQNKLQTSVLDNPLVIVSPDKPLIDKVGNNGTIWFDTSQNENGIVILNKYDTAKGEWITVQQTPSSDKVAEDIEEAKKDANLYAQILSEGRELAILKGDTFPTTAIEGQLFIYEVNNDMYRWNGNEWVIIGTSQTYMLQVKEDLQQEMRDLVASADIKIHVSENPPEDTNLIWHDTANDALKMYINGQWQVVSTTEDNIKNIVNVQTATKFDDVNDVLEVVQHTQTEQAGLIERKISKDTYNLDMENLNATVESHNSRITQTEKLIEQAVDETFVKNWTQAELDALKLGKRNYFAICDIENIAISNNTIVANANYKGFAWEVKEGEEWTLFRESVSNNRWGVYWFDEKPATDVSYVSIAFRNDTQNAFEVNHLIVPDGITYGFIYLTNQNDTLPNIVLEKGNKASTSWYPSVEDEEADKNYIGKQIEANATKISETAEAIKLLATQTNVDTLTGRITKAEGSIETNAQSITQLVSRVSNTEEGIEETKATLRTTAETIEGLATKKELTATNQTITEARELIDANTGAISNRATKAELTNAIANLDIGGTNLFSGYPVRDTQIRLTDYQGKGGFTQFPDKLVFDPSTTIGTTYTVSFEAKSPNGETTISVYNNNGNPRYFKFNHSFTEKVTTSWKRFVYTFENKDAGSGVTTANIVNRIEIYAPDKLGVIVRNIKVEKGNKVTDWSPCPADTEKRLIDVEEATFDILPNQISSKVSLTNYQADQQTLQSQLSGINSSITQKANEIALNVANNKFNSLTIGGNNLLRNSRFVSDAEQWDGMDYLIFEENDKKLCARLDGAIGTTKSINQSIYDEIKGDVHGTQEYTVSALVRCDNYVAGTTNPYCSLYFDGSYDKDGTATWMGATTVSGSSSIASVNGKGWQRLVWTVKFVQVPTRLNFHLYFRDFTGTIRFRDVKIERGNKATDWSPNQLELGEYYANLETRMQNAEIKLEDDSITHLVTQSEAFEIALSTKANSEDLADLATPQDIQKAIEDADIEGTFDSRISQYIQDPQSNLNLHFVTSAKWQEQKDNINAQFGYAGGLNFVKNSCGLAGLDLWTPSSSTTKNYIKGVADLSANQLGLPSVFEIKNTGSATYIYQTISVVPNRDYTLSCYINKLASSSDTAHRTDIYVQILDTNNTTLKNISLANATTTNGYKWYNVSYTPTVSQLRIRVYGYQYAEGFVGGIMLHEGTIPLKWSCHSEETYNANVRMDINGIKVIQQDNNKNPIGYTAITPTEFAGYYDTDGNGTHEKIFYLNQDAVISKRSVAQNEIIMGNLKFVNLSSGGYNGWALVPSTANDWSLTEGENQ